MKKSLLCLALLAGFTAAASAQSGVTIFGTVDLSGKYVKNDGSDKRLSLSRDGKWVLSLVPGGPKRGLSK